MKSRHLIALMTLVLVFALGSCTKYPGLTPKGGADHSLRGSENIGSTSSDGDDTGASDPSGSTGEGGEHGSKGITDPGGGDDDDEHTDK
jgi:hypothetical protein